MGGDITFTSLEKRNIAMFTAGLMCFKFAFESLGGAVNQFVLGRFEGGAVTKLSLLLILYGISQSIGSMLVSQLVRVFHASKVISSAMVVFASLCGVYILLEACTGGTLKEQGNWNPYIIFPIYICMGGCLGVMELVRRIIPSFVVGTDSEKLKKMAATVHIFYEVAGTSGAFASTALMEALKPVYATVLIPPLFLIGAVFYYLVSHNAPALSTDKVEIEPKAKKPLPIRAAVGIKNGLVNYGKSLKLGASIVFGNRQLIWLMVGYVLPLVIHRITENLLFSVFSKKILKRGSLSGVLLGGSNFGELCGAALVLKFNRVIKTPIPWVRVDAITLGILWVLAYANSDNAVTLAIALIPAMMVLSGSWAAGDVSLLAYIQAQFPEEDVDADEAESNPLSPIGSVMGFLYASYVLISTLLYFGLGRVFDNNDPQTAFFWIAGVSLSICGVIVFCSTFIPRGSWAINPNAEDLVGVAVIRQELDSEGLPNISPLETIPKSDVQVPLSSDESEKMERMA